VANAEETAATNEAKGYGLSFPAAQDKATGRMRTRGDAQRDADLYDVEALLDWREIEGGGGYEYKVRWAGRWNHSKWDSWVKEDNIINKGRFLCAAQKYISNPK
jgi:hypothetical protein